MTPQPVGRPPIGVTKKVSLTLSQKTWDWLEKQAEEGKSKMFRHVILDGMRRSMISDLLCQFPGIKIRSVQGNFEYSERVVVPKGLMVSVVKHVTAHDMFVVEKGTWVEDENYTVIDVTHDPMISNYIDDHFLYN